MRIARQKIAVAVCIAGWVLSAGAQEQARLVKYHATINAVKYT